MKVDPRRQHEQHESTHDLPRSARIQAEDPFSCPDRAQTARAAVSRRDCPPGMHSTRVRKVTKHYTHGESRQSLGFMSVGILKRLELLGCGVLSIRNLVLQEDPLIVADDPGPQVMSGDDHVNDFGQIGSYRN